MMNGLDMVSYWMIGICFLDATRFRENCFCIGLISFPFYAFLRAWQRLFKATLRGVDRVHFSEPLRVLVCELGMDTIAPQTPLGLGSPAGCAVSPDSISAGNRPPPPALPSASTVAPGSGTRPETDRGSFPQNRSATDSQAQRRDRQPQELAGFSLRTQPVFNGCLHKRPATGRALRSR